MQSCMIHDAVQNMEAKINISSILSQIEVIYKCVVLLLNSCPFVACLFREQSTVKAFLFVKYTLLFAIIIILPIFWAGL